MQRPLTTGASVQEKVIVQQSSKPTYAQIAQSHQFPTKEQAIVMNALNGIPIKSYIMEIGKITDPANIRFASRIFQGRVCFYLDSKATADSLIDYNAKITLENQVIEIRPLISRMKRIILSNVCPIIPHEEILQVLDKKYGVQTTSQMSFIRAGVYDAGYSHILSFRRQIYVHPEDIEKLPPSFQIDFDETSYWIYLSTDKVSCFLCKEEGHLVKFCKQTETQVQLNSQLSLDNNTHPNNMDIDWKLPSRQEKQNDNRTQTKDDSYTFLRPHPSTTLEK